MRLKTVLLAAAAVILPAGLALAQTPVAPTAARPPAKPAAAAPTAVEGVVVTSDANAMRTSIDRRSYSVANDLSARTGSISDALRNIPSVEVDVQGNVSLRGDANVTILIDGKPSGLFSGDGKADALHAMPADQIDRVEVMTNPSAAFRPDGSAGIINLITKKTRKAGASGSVRANASSDGRYNTGVSGSYIKGKLTLAGDAGYRHDEQKFRSFSDRSTFDTASGLFQDSRQASQSEGAGDSTTLRANADYDLDARTRVSAELSYRGMAMDMDSHETYQGENTAGQVIRAYDRLSNFQIDRDNTEAKATWRRQFKGSEHELVAAFEYGATKTARDLRAFTDNAAAADYYETSSFAIDQTRTSVSLDYTRPLPGSAKLKTGFDFDLGLHNDYDNRGARGATPGGLVIDPARTNRFVYDQSVYAGYATYERPFGDLTVQTGVRVEQVTIDTNQITSGLKGANDYLRAYPTLFFSYALSGDQQLRANYSRRVQRPQAQDLNPYRVYQDPFNYRAGNPDLKPQVTDSYELGWQYRQGQAYYLATAYYRQSAKGVTDVVRDLGGGVLLTTKENLGQSRNGGLELVANGRLTPKLTYNLSGNLFWNEIDAANLGFANTRSGTSASGRASLNWQVTPADFLQISGFTSGRRLTPQGYREPVQMLNLGYRRKVSDKLSFVVTVQDALDTFRDAVITDTPTLRDRTERMPRIRSVFFGLTYSFGGAKPKPQGFDFDTGAATVG
ncbi:MAG: TonB-dependent receptor [Alphaproteobacteria bacterium]|nr:TonB-dependent receptor [Alphaproteobacteria bacterium]